MKGFFVFSLFFSTASFAQSIDLNSFKNLMTQRQSGIERVNQGMSKKLTTVTRVPTRLGPCEITETAVQTILKIEGDKIIVHSKEKYVPTSTPACASFKSEEVAVLFFENKPTLSGDLADLNESASFIKSILKEGEIVTMNLSIPDEGTDKVEAVTVKYDLIKPLFKNILLIKDSVSTVTGTDMADINVNTIDLKDVPFCESADSDNCSQGDWSDILYF